MSNITLVNTRTLATAVVDSSLYASYFFADPNWVVQNQAGSAALPDSHAVNGTLGEAFAFSMAEETVTLSGSFTDTVGNLLPANSIILGVDVRIKTTITTAVSFTVGTVGATSRFAGASTDITAGLVTTGRAHWAAGLQNQGAAAKVRISPNTTPGAGAVSIVVYYVLFTSQNQ